MGRLLGEQRKDEDTQFPIVEQSAAAATAAPPVRSTEPASCAMVVMRMIFAPAVAEKGVIGEIAAPAAPVTTGMCVIFHKSDINLDISNIKIYRKIFVVVLRRCRGRPPLPSCMHEKTP
ncbi:MAG: hypothetical protein ABW048_06450, partial [Sphingobium sp.]